MPSFEALVSSESAHVTAVCRCWTTAAARASSGGSAGGRWGRRTSPPWWRRCSPPPATRSEQHINLLEPLTTLHTVLCRLQVLGHGQGLACLYVALHLHPHLASKVCIRVSGGGDGEAADLPGQRHGPHRLHPPHHRHAAPPGPAPGAGTAGHVMRWCDMA